MKKWISALAIVMAAVWHADAQKVVADKIVAQVGDQIVLKSDIDAGVDEAKRDAAQVGAPSLPANYECVVTQQYLMQKVLYMQATTVDSLPLSDDDLDAELDNRIRYYVRSYGSREALEAVMGKSIFQFKEEMRPRIREQRLANQERQKIVEDVKITPEEVQQYYNTIPKDSLPFYESQMEISQIVMHPKANNEVKELIEQRLLGFKRDVESGKAKFDVLARNYSEEPSAKETGGQFSINRLDKMFDPTFTSAAFRLKEGQISPVVETPFGLHIIQMISKVGDDAVVRHIIMIPPVTEIETNKALKEMDTIRDAILENRTVMGQPLTFNAAVAMYSDDKAGKMFGGAITSQDGSTHIAYDQIQDKSLLPVLDTIKVGEISKPQIFQDMSEQGRGQSAVRMIYLRSKTEAHRENMKDDYDKISVRALQEKQMRILNNWFTDHIGSFYVKLDKDLNQCQNLAIWKAASDKLEKE